MRSVTIACLPWRDHKGAERGFSIAYLWQRSRRAHCARAAAGDRIARSSLLEHALLEPNSTFRLVSLVREKRE